MLTTLAVFLLLGLALTLRGLRGRRTDDHSLCRRCRFDLTGRPADAERRCPECGAGLDRPRAVVVGHRRRRPILLAGGGSCLLAVAGVAGVFGYGRARGVNWLAHAPAWYLIREAATADPARRGPAVAELAARYADGRLSPGPATDRVADAALAYQGDVRKPWDTGWGDLVERLRADGRLDDARWRRYAEQGAAGTMVVAVRPRVRRGDPIPFDLHWRPGRVAAVSRLCPWVEDMTASAQWPVPVPPTPVQESGPFRLSDAEDDLMRRTLPAGSVPPGLPDGVQTLRFTARVTVCPLDPDGHSGQLWNPIVTVPLDVPATFRLQPAAERSVRLVPDPSVRPAVVRSLRCLIERIRHAPKLAGQAEACVVFDHPPTTLAYDVILRSGGRETTLGHDVYRPGDDTIHGYTVPQGLIVGDRADLLFRPDPATAAETMDAEAIWPGELVVRDVPMQWDDPPGNWGLEDPKAGRGPDP